MDTGIGLPYAVPDTPAPVITEWARRAEQGGFSTLGPMADQIAAGAAVSPDQVRGAAAAFEQAGCDELIFVPCSAETSQVGLLAEVLHG